MGEAALAREFRARPPREKLDSLAALWRDYMWRYVNAERQDPCLYYTIQAPNLSTAIRRACDSRGADGKMFFHQSKVTQEARDELCRRLLVQKRMVSLMMARNFDAVYRIVARASAKTHGIGPVTEYDVTDRIASYLGHEPDRLYFHAGVREGLIALGLRVPRGKRSLGRAELPKFLRSKNLGLAESFLCGYRSEIERVVGKVEDD